MVRSGAGAHARSDTSCASVRLPEAAELLLSRTAQRITSVNPILLFSGLTTCLKADTITRNHYLNKRSNKVGPGAGSSASSVISMSMSQSGLSSRLL